MAGQPLSGQGVCGDHWVALDAGGERALLAVIDGVGHGPPAAIASRCAAEVLTEHRAEPLDVLLPLCHRALAHTRGAAVTVALIDRDRLSWMGVGNVAASVVGVTPGGVAPRAEVLLRGGILGYRMPPRLHPRTASMRIGDVLLMATDGLAADFAENVPLREPVEVIAADLLARCAKRTDDALVLAARRRGPTR